MKGPYLPSLSSFHHLGDLFFVPAELAPNFVTPLDAGASTVNIVRGTHEQLIAFLVLNVWPSHFGLPLLLAVVIFSKSIRRHVTFINLCVAFIIIGISSSLLLYAGKFEGPAEPSQMLCLLQASLLYGMPGLSSMAAFMLVLHMFLVIRAHYHGREYLDRDHPLRLWAMAVAPYAVFLICILATAAIGSTHPERVSRNRRFFYCSLDSLPLTNTLTIVAAIILLATATLEVWAILILYRKWKIQRNSFPDRGTLELSLPIRIITFGFYIIIALSLSLLSIKSPESPVPDLMIATAASVVMFIFGTQKDILRALCFWNRDSPQKVKSLDSTTSSVDLKSEFPESDRMSYYEGGVLRAFSRSASARWVVCYSIAPRVRVFRNGRAHATSSSWSRLPPHSRCLATAAAESSSTPANSNDPTLNRIVDDISKLTLLQAADLVTLLKEKPKEKTIFTVKLESFDAGAKPKIIKEVKSLVPNLTLIEAKKFVESVPKVLKENLSKEEAEKLQKVFQDLGGVVKLE
ncbi:hypothetical protein NP233_g5108 [Leucocoprinus birnbaumii]|uniref:Ribosomal protein L7/L12 C-terminal domain-containing protein n=1 Tax=Leucocoprinus birnbaumii TaxID=56174 RepID=A0AAD5YR87_9AGAR|nr:hypothetical protein NP233_g5108 [Leucocoprinus birnbaumii]